MDSRFSAPCADPFSLLEYKFQMQLPIASDPQQKSDTSCGVSQRMTKLAPCMDATVSMALPLHSHGPPVHVEYCGELGPHT